jgi:hypothetical protein
MVRSTCAMSLACFQTYPSRGDRLWPAFAGTGTGIAQCGIDRKGAVTGTRAHISLCGLRPSTSVISPAQFQLGKTGWRGVLSHAAAPPSPELSRARREYEPALPPWSTGQGQLNLGPSCVGELNSKQASDSKRESTCDMGGATLARCCNAGWKEGWQCGCPCVRTNGGKAFIGTPPYYPTGRCSMHYALYTVLIGTPLLPNGQAVRDSDGGTCVQNGGGLERGFESWPIQYAISLSSLRGLHRTPWFVQHAQCSFWWPCPLLSPRWPLKTPL